LALAETRAENDHLTPGIRHKFASRSPSDGGDGVRSMKSVVTVTPRPTDRQEPVLGDLGELDRLRLSPSAHWFPAITWDWFLLPAPTPRHHAGDLPDPIVLERPVGGALRCGVQTLKTQAAGRNAR